jgi:small subunit ribosomal protein S16
MPVKIRLSRQGRKRIPYYHIVAADSRAPRDGRYIERLGKYYPKTNPATVELDFDRALYWLQTGAQPTDTCRSILSEKGVLMKKHLLEGVKKNAMTVEQAEEKFQAWVSQKEQKEQQNQEKTKQGKLDAGQKRLEAETKAREAKAAVIQQKKAAAAKAAEPAANTESAEAAGEPNA